MAMNKGLKVAIGIATIGVVGVGAYFLYKRVIKPKLEKKKEEDKNDKEANNSTKISEAQAKAKGNTGNTSAIASKGATPFSNSTEGNKFRQWVNDTYPKYAEKIDLDETGSYDNWHIRKAWAEYGNEYEKDMGTEGAVYNITFGSKFQGLKNKWNKSHSISKGKRSLNVPYITIPAKDNMGYKWNDLNFYVYDRLAGEKVGGKNGEGFWSVYRKKKGGGDFEIANGRWDDDLTTITILKSVYMNGKPTGMAGETLSGGKEVGNKIKQAIKSNNSFSWA